MCIIQENCGGARTDGGRDGRLGTPACLSQAWPRWGPSRMKKSTLKPFQPGRAHTQAPKPSPAELSPEELQTVALFQENTPTVVNIANIGAPKIAAELCWQVSCRCYALLAVCHAATTSYTLNKSCLMAAHVSAVGSRAFGAATGKCAAQLKLLWAVQHRGRASTAWTCSRCRRAWVPASSGTTRCTRTLLSSSVRLA